MQPVKRKSNNQYHTMNVSFQINYRAEYGQSLCVIETKASILGWTEEHPLVMNCHGQDFWTVSLPISDFAGGCSTNMLSVCSTAGLSMRRVSRAN